MPRSLYGRAALILLVPVVTLQLVVSVVFIQRHYEGVTEQMTRNVALELRYLQDLANQAPELAVAVVEVQRLAPPLAFDVAMPAQLPEADVRAFYDLSGKAMARTLRSEMQGVLRVDLSADRTVLLWIDTQNGVMRAGFDRRRISASNPHQLLVLMVFAGLLFTLIAFVFLRNQLRPIKRLARASEAFGKGRSDAYRPTGALEVRAAGNAFLDMRSRIERQIEQRTMMLSGVSHDLRTPLTRLRLGLSLMEDQGEAEAMLRDIGDMERLLDEFLAFARDDALDDPEPVDPVELVRDVVARHRPAAVIGEVTGAGSAVLRPMAVTRALENLIGNAVQYGSRCVVGLVITEKALRITVEDDGPGIAPVDREQALKPFVRLDAARNQNRGSGVGLGLAIARDIARRHGGALILAESAAFGGLKADLVLAR